MSPANRLPHGGGIARESILEIGYVNDDDEFHADVQFAYAIGHPDPVSVLIETFGTATVADAKITRAIAESALSL